MKLVAINEDGRSIGEHHGRAKLTDHDVELIVSLLECREMLITEYLKVGLTRREIERSLHVAQMSYAGIAGKFEISKSHVRNIALGAQRSQIAVRWKRVEEQKTKPEPCPAKP
jgi:hypothetical protein